MPIVIQSPIKCTATTKIASKQTAIESFDLKDIGILHRMDSLLC